MFLKQLKDKKTSPRLTVNRIVESLLKRVKVRYVAEGVIDGYAAVDVVRCRVSSSVLTQESWRSAPGWVTSSAAT